jgi:retinol-binding protein 3
MNNLLKTFVFNVVLLFVLTNFAFAQNSRFDAKLRTETIDEVLRLLRDKYSYPEIAVKMESAIREKQKRGDYDSIVDGALFAERITADLRTVFDDKHLALSYSAEPISLQSGKAGAPSPEEIEAARRKQSRENFGVVKVEILKGNVGLIQINYFAPLDWSADAYAAAFNLVANTDALIIDVRRNTGSMDVNTVPFFSSYLFGSPVHFTDFHSRETNETRQLWTSPKVPGNKYLDKPIYVLTSARTASGAETFVSSVKRLKRAVLVGETTMGATMPGMSHRVNQHFSIWISTGRSANRSAENKGVSPDIEATPENALNTAHAKALNQLLQINRDEVWKAESQNIISTMKNQKP